MVYIETTVFLVVYRALNKKTTTHIKTAEGLTEEVPLQSGIRQGTA
jgi:hypothetical protein